MIDETRQLRFYVGLFVVFMAFMPTLMFTLGATQTSAGRDALIPALVGGPFNLVALVFLVRGMISNEPSRAGRLLWIGAALTFVGDVLMYSIYSLLT